MTTLVDAAKVRNLLEHEQFDLVLSDIQMPNIDGFELVRIIRNNNNPEIAAIPVIALSGKRNLNPEDFTSKGFTAFHPKPLRLEELLLLMKSIFNGKPVDVAVQVAEARKDEKLFDLSSLNKFTQNDPVSLKLIVDTFITSVSENTEALRQATCEMNLKRMSEVAHKMIPMLKQMEVYSISDLLEPIEDQSLEYDKEEMEKYVAIIFQKLSVLISELEKEIG